MPTRRRLAVYSLFATSSALALTAVACGTSDAGSGSADEHDADDDGQMSVVNDASTAKGDDDTNPGADAAIDSTVGETDASGTGDGALASDAPLDAALDAPFDAPSDGPFDAPDGADAATPSLLSSLGFDGVVYSAVHSGTSVYIAGLFDRVSNHTPNNWITLNATGTPTSCAAGTGVDGGQISASVQIGGSVYLGGVFQAFNGQAVRELVKVDAATCALDTTFNPPGTTGFNNQVVALGSFNGALYVGGYFTTYRGASANRIAKLDPTTGALDTTFSPPANNGFDSNVNALAFSGTSVYAGGAYSAYRGIGGSAAARVVKLDKDTGALDTTFSPGFSSDVFALAVAGTSLYAGGRFTQYRGSNITYVAKVDLATAQPDTTFSPTTGSNGTDGIVYALATGGTSLYIGGLFAKYRGTSTGPLAKVDLTSGLLDTTFSTGTSVAVHGSSFPPVTAEVFSLATLGTSVYVGGTFSDYRGAQNVAHSFAKLDAASGALDTTFRPAGESADGFEAAGESLAIVDSISAAGGGLLVSGSFTMYGGHLASNIAKLDAATFAFDTTFSPPAANGFDANVDALTSVGSSIYVGGAFTAYRGVAGSANHLAKLDATSGALDTTFSPAGANGFEGTARALLISGISLYAGGDFDTYRGIASSAHHIAKLDATSGAIDTTFSPPGAISNGFDSYVDAFAISGTSLFVGGDFSAYRGVSGSAQRIAKLDLNSGSLDTTFTPTTNNGFDGYVAGLSVAGSSLYVAGSFGQYGTATTRFLAKLDTTNAAFDTTFVPQNATSANQAFDGQTTSILALNGSLYVGGFFQSYRGTLYAADGIAKLDPATGDLDTTFNITGVTPSGFDNAVNAMAVVGTNLVCGGQFRTYRGTSRTAALGVVDLASGTLR